MLQSWWLGVCQWRDDQHRDKVPIQKGRASDCRWKRKSGFQQVPAVWQQQADFFMDTSTSTSILMYRLRCTSLTWPRQFYLFTALHKPWGYMLGGTMHFCRSWFQNLSSSIFQGSFNAWACETDTSRNHLSNCVNKHCMQHQTLLWDKLIDWLIDWWWEKKMESNGDNTDIWLITLWIRFPGSRKASAES